MSQPNIPPLFDRLPAGLFRALGAENGRRYWDVLARLLEELWGEGGRSPGEETQRGVVVRTIENLLAADDPWDADLDTPIGIRAHGLVNLFVETGWLAQRRRGLVEMVTIRPVVAQFYTVLSDFALHEPEFLGSKVRSIYLNLRAIAAGEASGDQYAEAAKQSKRCMAHIANTGCRVQDLMEALLKRTTAREFVSGFFEDYIQKVFIADYSELRTRDHPLQHRSAIIALTLQFQHDETKREALLRWYQEKVASGDRVKAELLYERDTRQLMRLREVDQQLQRLDEEIRDANQRAMTFLEYKLRAPKHLDKLIARALHATDAMEEAAIALPAAPGRRHISEWGLAKPRMLARIAPSTAVEGAPPTIEELAMEALRRRMAENRMVKPVHLANYVVRHLVDKRAVSSDELSITSINDLCCYQRLLLIASRSDCPPAMRRSDPLLQMLKRVQITFDADGITRNNYMEHRRFTIQREHA
ncbi:MULTISPECIES: Wadjet anti-phage system protein JetA family protein [Xanthomonas]|uniref:Wadjet anti-phage system protein JetA family protein n=1 Tax=Xanthomonas TaxID=338 RepID=UPI001C481F1B|nr:Wadjet anti-phage system protein JetA family protein [Xanthomonas campestris]MBV6868184.1 hypothetical protein [Xanthomonas campestris pv. coriandri]MCE4331106.1 DUF5716 family protein [Xanthomonas campestris pv. coriandri]MEB1101552.1 Wadjet anti-phage system protein JetA family protein [Xanthomonas campestris pv. campestris]MEB1181676.1 Wadjet anti-phage system protein JetA family protein [Xanthomonas campestris pv. campestris]MEB1432031.1 Wadjet anti-phage system protein JetA family prot